MKIILSKYCGFCDGVGRAFRLVSQSMEDQKNHQENLYILGSLAHNQGVTKKVQDWGIKKIADLDSIKPKDTVIVAAHGVGKQILDEIYAKGAKVFQTTCPKVVKVQSLASYFYKKGFQIIIYGDAEHKEVKGINGWTNNSAKVIKSLEEAQNLVLDWEKTKDQTPAILLSQTTQSVTIFEKINSLLEKKAQEIKKKLQIFNTICSSTSDRQEELKTLAISSDAVLVIGGKESGNTKRLFEISKTFNDRTIWISDLTEQTHQELSFLLKSCQSVAVTSGASTPSWEINELVNFLETLRV